MEIPFISRIRPQEIGRFVRFALVGAVGTLVDFGVLIVMKELAGLPLLLANTLSYSAGIANNFTLNRLWTFPDARGKRAWVQFGQFAAISAIGLLINDLIVGLLGGPLGALIDAPDAGYIAAKVVATGLVLVWNFTMNRLWTFGDAPQAEWR